MWKCEKCGYKNGNLNKKCRGCKQSSSFKKKEKKKVLDLCPKCKKEIVFTFERNKMVEIEQESIGGGRNVKTRVEKRYRCTECQSLCRQTGKSKTFVELTIPEDTGDGAN